MGKIPTFSRLFSLGVSLTTICELMSSVFFPRRHLEQLASGPPVGFPCPFYVFACQAMPGSMQMQNINGATRGANS